MTNTTARAAAVRITAVCSFCARRFTPQLGAGGPMTPRCDDFDGRICCDACMCAYCDRGHATEADAALCEGDSLYPAGEQSAFDYDAWVDATRHVFAER